MDGISKSKQLYNVASFCFLILNTVFNINGKNLITKDFIKNEIDKIPEEYLAELCRLIKNFENDVKNKKKQSFMSKLRSIKIDGPKDFSKNIDLYLSGENEDKKTFDPYEFFGVAQLNMTVEEIDQKCRMLRDEWERNFK